MTTTPPRRLATYRTPFGEGWVAYDESGIVEMGLPGTSPPVEPTGDVPKGVQLLASRLEGYFQGGALPEASHDLIAGAASTAFLESVYDIVCRIAPGTTLTYAEVAARAGRPGAARAVGAAMARNPMAPVIPCHRVVGSGGGLRGYGGGLEMKRALLDMEAANA